MVVGNDDLRNLSVSLIRRLTWTGLGSCSVFLLKVRKIASIIAFGEFGRRMVTRGHSRGRLCYIPPNPRFGLFGFLHNLM